ncbi:MAG: hypothetical protein RKR03_17350 [Candidatus Competibacter sp.]|nr:hypothetical protein [Candidatus Competibacter sp.]
MTDAFADHFTSVAADYASFRPTWAERGHDPVGSAGRGTGAALGISPDRRTVEWPLALRAGRV